MPDQQLHYPEEWGPSHDRKLTCACGHPDPGHRDPKPPVPVEVAACQWPSYPGHDTFRVWKEEPENEHAPWFAIMPGGDTIKLASADDSIDEARANWIAHTLNAALARGIDSPEGVETQSGSTAKPQEPGGEATRPGTTAPPEAVPQGIPQGVEADAGRYRWLRDQLLAADFAYGEPPQCVVVFNWPPTAGISADLDASIDAAISQGEQKP
jgi:hypothetical protein